MKDSPGILTEPSLFVSLTRDAARHNSLVGSELVALGVLPGMTEARVGTKKVAVGFGVFVGEFLAISVNCTEAMVPAMDCAVNIISSSLVFDPQLLLMARINSTVIKESIRFCFFMSFTKIVLPYSVRLGIITE